jgi:uncharacterized membrane protein
MKELSVKECLTTGWNDFSARPWLLIGSSVLIFILSMIADIPRTAAHGMHGGEAVAVGIIGFLVSIGLTFLIAMGKTAFYLRAHDSIRTATLNNLWHPHPYWRFVGTSLLAGIVTIIGLILLIVPGIIIGIIVGFAAYIVIDRGLAPFDALRESARITKGNRWKLFLLGLAVLGINIIGFCLLLIGLFVTMPITALAVMHAYRTLSAT